MRFKTTVLLLILNLCLFAYIYFSHKQEQAQTGLIGSQRLLLDTDFSLSLDSVFIINHATQQEWEFSNRSSHWELRKPFNWRANPYAMEQLLFTLQNLHWDSRFLPSDPDEGGLALADYALDPGRIEIRLGRSNLQHTLHLGNATGIGQRQYLRSSGSNHVYVVSQTLMRLLEVGADEFMDPAIFKLSIEQARAIQIQDRTESNVRIRLVRAGNAWSFASPIEAPANGERVNSLIESWRQMRVSQFIDAGLRPATLAENYQIRLTFEGINDSETLSIYPMASDNGGTIRFVGKLEPYPTYFEIPVRAVQPLRQAQENLREMRLLRPMAHSWTRLEVYTDADRLTVQRLENGIWQVLRTTPDGNLLTLPADERRIARLQEYFAEMEGVRIALDSPVDSDLERFGLNEPQRRISLRSATGETLEMRIGTVASDANLLYASTNRSRSVFLLRPQILAEVPLNPRHYQQRRLRGLAATEAVGTVRLIGRDSDTVIVTTDNMDDPLAAQALHLLRDWIGSIEVEQIHHREFSDPFRLDAQTPLEWEYELQAVITSATDPATVLRREILLISRRLGGTTQYVGDAESGLVGTLPGDLIEALDPLLAKYPEQMPALPPEVEPSPP